MANLKSGDQVRIVDGPDIGRTGVIETVETSDEFGIMCSVRLNSPVKDGPTERVISNSLGVDQLELI